jgi:hypothetical protein
MNTNEISLEKGDDDDQELIAFQNETEIDKWPDYLDTALAIGFFVGLIFFWWFLQHMQINYASFCLLSSYIFLGLLAALQLYRTIFTSRRINYLDIMRLILVSPFIALLVFAINYLTPQPEYVVRYKIINEIVKAKNNTTDEVELFLENEALDNFKTIRMFTTETNTYDWQQLECHYAKGLFGYNNINSRAIILEDGNKIVY